MPLVEITAPAGSLPETAIAKVQREVANVVLRWMELPQTDFFAGATWVYVREAETGRAATGAPGVAPGFLVVVTPLEGFLTPARNESLASEITAVLRDAATEAGPESPVWTVVHEVPEGYWAVNGALTRRAKLDELISQAQ
jgi:phenylpyruvate tautomerase PptA (4-oxalocrotonate tautomerase family)